MSSYGPQLAVITLIAAIVNGALGYGFSSITVPLALHNQGLAKREFRAALGFVRLAESSFTAVAYWYAGLFTSASLALAPAILPSLLIGVPLGAWLIRRINAETFRRICMSFDAWVVGFGISTLLRTLHVVATAAAYGVLAAVVAVDLVLLYRFFSAPRRASLTFSEFSTR